MLVFVVKYFVVTLSCLTVGEYAMVFFVDSDKMWHFPVVIGREGYTAGTPEKNV
jgi:hypothetical protein